jgi:hypothetical protein
MLSLLDLQYADLKLGIPKQAGFTALTVIFQFNNTEFNAKMQKREDYSTSTFCKL